MGPGWSSPLAGGPGGPLDGEETVHRDVVRRARPTEEPPEKPSNLRRNLLIATGVLVLAGAGAGTYLALQGGDDEGANPEETTTTETTEAEPTETTSGDPEVVEPPTGLTAAVNEAGVHLQWNGDNAAEYVVIVMGEDGSRDFLTAELGTNRLLPDTALRPDIGYCFAVAEESTFTGLPTDQAANAFSTPACIRGADADTVLGGG